jgi:hypothetical protein
MFTFLDERKRAKMQLVQDPSQSNVDNLNNVRREASRHFRNKSNEYMKAKIEELCIETLLCASVGTASHQHRLEACTVYGDITVCSCRHSKSSVCVRRLYCVQL